MRRPRSPTPISGSAGHEHRSPAFLNRVRSLFNIDGDQLPELDRDEWRSFRDDPVRFFMRADDWQAAAIWREVEKRQARRVVPPPALSLSSAAGKP
jgi:hypothetical protein